MPYEFKRPLTVGDMKRILNTLPDDLHIVTEATPESSYSDWFNIGSIELPSVDFENGYSAVTLRSVDTFDARQF